MATTRQIVAPPKAHREPDVFDDVIRPDYRIRDAKKGARRPNHENDRDEDANETDLRPPLASLRVAA